MMRRIPGKSLFAAKAHFLKAGPHDADKRAKSRRRRKLFKAEERRAERGDIE